MAFIQWSKALEVNVPIMDKQHKSMVKLANKLHEAFQANNKVQIKKTLGLIVEDLREHFDTEEKLISETKLPYFISHKLEHERYYNKFLGLYLNVKTGNAKLTPEDIKSIKIWFFNHLEFKDRALAEHILSQKSKELEKV